MTSSIAYRYFARGDKVLDRIMQQAKRLLDEGYEILEISGYKKIKEFDASDDEP